MSYIFEYNELLQSSKIPACKRLLRVYDSLTTNIKYDL